MKRFFDLICILLCAPLIFIFFITIGFIVFVKLGHPIFFSQPRPGLNGKIFNIIKFRTMSNRTHNGDLLPDDQRINHFGKFLRSTSLDELPSLWNIFKGEMSLVGPRPLLVQYLPLYSNKHARRHETRPGLTGWAQINGRNAINWDEKLDFDVWYVDNQSIWLDIKILCFTVKKVVMRSGINQEGHVSADFFEGSNEKK
jgi:lipopolysaccharide/colanic/teichoic acid biosynthesis glycosyltransferase